MCRVIMAWLSLCKNKLVSIKKTCIHKHKTKKIIQAKIKHDIITRHLLKFHILASKSAWAPVITLLWNLKCYITECQEMAISLMQCSVLSGLSCMRETFSRTVLHFPCIICAQNQCSRCLYILSSLPCGIYFLFVCIVCHIFVLYSEICTLLSINM